MKSAIIQPTYSEILADKFSNLAAYFHAATQRFLVMDREFDEREVDISTRTEAAYEHREFSWRETNDGSIEFFGRLPAERAEKSHLRH